MVRSALIVALAAIFGSILGLMSWMVFLAAFMRDPSVPAVDQLLIGTVTEPFILLLAGATLVFTIPGAALLLVGQDMLQKRAFSRRAQAVVIITGGPLAGAACFMPVSMVMKETLLGPDLATGAWFGLTTASVFLWLSPFRPDPTISI